MQSVRAKFVSVIALCLLPLLGATLFISRALEQEQREDALQRLRSAQQSFETGLGDDVTKLQLAVRLLSTGPGVAAALQKGDVATLERRLRHVGAVWPNAVPLIIVGPDGKTAASAEAMGRLASFPPGLVGKALRGPFRGVSRLTFPSPLGRTRAAGSVDLCPHGPCSYPVYAVAEPIQADGKALGAVIAVFSLTRAWVEAAEKRTGLDLELRVGDTKIDLLKNAGGGPAPMPGPPELRHPENRDLAVVTFTTPLLTGDEPVLVAASLDLTELARDHRRFLLYRLAAVAVIGLFALGVAFRVARRMHA